MKVDVVIGPPGCGKTAWLARQVELASAAGEQPAVMSLTRAAAREVAARGLKADDRSVGTLHSLAYRALGNPEIADIPKHLREWNERHPLLRMPMAMGRDIDDDNVAPKSQDLLGAKLMSQWNIARARREPTPAQCESFAELWREWLEETGRTDFTGLIERALHETHWAPGRPTVLFVDEAQDLSALELALVHHWAQDGKRLVMVGDPYQNLYHWRGTDAGAFAARHGVVLSQSYRVPAAVHDRATRWIRHMQGWRPIEYSPTDQPGAVRQNSATWRTPQPLLPQIERDIERGKTVMILTTCAYMLRPIIQILRNRGIAYHNPYRRKSRTWNPLHIISGKITGRERVLAFLRPTSESLDWERGDVAAWTSAVRAADVIRSGRRNAVKDVPDDILSMEDVLTTEAMDAALSGDVDWLWDHALAGSRAGLTYPIRIAKLRGRDALRREPKVIVGTIHSVKGGEADSVYLFPDLSGAGMDEWLGGARAPIYRLFYVGMTRSRESLTICARESTYAVEL